MKYSKFVRFICGLFALCSLVVSKSCVSHQGPYAFDYPTSITYGEYGGFAGKYVEYRMLPDGTVYVRKSISGTFQLHKGVDQDVCDQMFALMDGTIDRGAIVEESGNVTRFLTYSVKGKELYRSSWSLDAEAPIAREIKDLHRLLSKLSREGGFKR